MLQELPPEASIDAIVDDVIDIQGWGSVDGGVVRRRNFKDLQGVFGDLIDGLAQQPYAVLVQDGAPRAIIHTSEDLESREATLEQSRITADAVEKEGCQEAPLAISAVGSGKTGFMISVAKKLKDQWVPVSYRGEPASWLPTPTDVERLRADSGLSELEPHIPSSSKMKVVGDRIDETLRDAKVKDSERALVVGATTLALWHTRGRIRRGAGVVIHEVNRATRAAFAEAGWKQPPRSLELNPQNTTLAEKLWRVIMELEKLGLTATIEHHDFLGQLYERVIRYSTGSTLGQYFTPMHIARFMALLAGVHSRSVIFDPTCGTGGFFVASIGVARERSGMSYDQTAQLMEENLYGYEVEPSTAALCMVNLILRGIRKAKISCTNCLSDTMEVSGLADVVLMNPPFPHRRSDTPTEVYVEQGLKGAKHKGIVAAIVPTSVLAKKKLKQWRSKVLEENTLLAVVQLPDDLFQPYAATTTSVILLKRGVPHAPDTETVFVRVEHDGHALHRGVRVAVEGEKDQLYLALNAVAHKREIPGVSGVATVSGEDEWSAGAYVPSGCPDGAEFEMALSEMLKVWASFYIRYADEVLEQRRQIAAGAIRCEGYRDIISQGRLRNARSLCSKPGTIGGEFDILYAMQGLDRVESIDPGATMIVSSTGQYNGCRGWYDYPQTIAPPFITVPCTGSIGEAFVQAEPCAVTSNCLILLPKNARKFGLVRMAMVAAAIRMEKWRFSYGRTLTPQRLAEIALPEDPRLEAWARRKMKALSNVVSMALEDAPEDTA